MGWVDFFDIPDYTFKAWTSNVGVAINLQLRKTCKQYSWKLNMFCLWVDFIFGQRNECDIDNLKKKIKKNPLTIN